MPYNLRFWSEFQCILTQAKSFRLEIDEKDYDSGGPEQVLLADDAVIQEWQDEEYKKAIRGSDLKIRIINEGNIPITYFYSDDDDKFRVKLIDLSTERVLFQGFILQDDCQEVQVNFAHVIELNATDNLGLLKDTTLSQAAYKFGSTNTIINIAINGVSNHVIRTTDDRLAALKPGEKFIVLSGALEGNYTVSFIDKIGSDYFIYVIEDSALTGGPYTTDIDITIPIDLNNYIQLTELFRLCLGSTNLQLDTKVLSQLYPINGSSDLWIEDSYLHGDTFLTDEGYLSCYDVLDIILSRFSATLFQAQGCWFIVRWGEFWRYSTVDGATYPYRLYDENFATLGGFLNFEDNHYFHDTTDLETGLLKSINRPINYAKETFNYKNVNNLKNGDLTKKGKLLNKYTAGANRVIRRYTIPGFEGFRIDGETIQFQRDQTFVISGIGAPDGTYTCLSSYNFNSTSFIILVSGTVPFFAPATGDIIYKIVREYEAEYWYDSAFIPPSIPRFIRETSDFQENLLETYLVLKATFGAAGLYGAKSNDIQVSAGDIIKVYVTFRSENSIPVTGTASFVDFAFTLTNNNTDFLFISTPGIWTDNAVLCFTYAIQPGDNWNNWHIAEAISNQVPYDGVFNIYMRHYPNTDMYFKDIKVTISNNVSGSIEIKGHYHLDQQFNNLKKVDDKSIQIDDSPRSSISGTLFLDFLTGILRQRSKNWNYVGASLSYSLGHMTTLENLFQNYYAKDIYNGRHLKISNGLGDIMSPVSVLVDSQDAELKRYVFGALSLNYREGTADFTMYEVDNSDITIAGFNDKNLYEFKYLYDKQ